MKYLQVHSASYGPVSKAADELVRASDSLLRFAMESAADEDIALESQDDEQGSKTLYEKIRALISRFNHWLYQKYKGMRERFKRLMKSIELHLNFARLYLFGKMDKVVAFYNRVAKTEKWRREEYVKYVDETLTDYQKVVFQIYIGNVFGLMSPSEILNNMQLSISEVDKLIAALNNMRGEKVFEITNFEFGKVLRDTARNVDGKSFTIQSLSERHPDAWSTSTILTVKMDDVKRDIEDWGKRAPDLFKKAEQCSERLNAAVENAVKKLSGLKFDEHSFVEYSEVMAKLQQLQRQCAEKLAGTDVAEALHFMSSLTKGMSVVAEGIKKFGLPEEEK